MKYQNDASKLTVVTVFVAYDRIETARRIKVIFDRAPVEIDELFTYDLRFWRLDILELSECWIQALEDLADADLFTISFYSENQSKVSPELICLVEKWFNGGGGYQSILLVSPDGAYEHDEFEAVLHELNQQSDLNSTSSNDYCDELREFFVHPNSRKMNNSSNFLS